ncbi:response regulator [Asticcacaulis sp. AC402]|uniref:response regulator n=1 Tax=Asticcacaulis sp. AC402 TaxID=1282361 RepID=UPI0003C3F47A|nr:response regulator [Asticcacaulis sp. AC402]ESQ75172.1 chemotaxis protein CheY [Asticcacaulis sp. AC402]
MTRLSEQGRSAQVLLIEDNHGDAVLTRRAFRRARMPSEITVAESGEAGLSILRREGPYADAPRPDLILLDLNLPHMHGHDFLSTVKDDPALKRIPVIVLSSSVAASDVRGAYDRHANGYISKPITTDTFDEIVAKIEDYWFGLMQLPPESEPKQFS